MTSPSLRFTPAAWAKMLFWRDLGNTEIGGFAISSAADPLLIEDVRLVRQQCSVVTVDFDDGSVADFFDEQVDAGLLPERFSRIWFHTHPAASPAPSRVDEATFARVFGAFHWSVMFIIARGGAAYARLQYRVGPGGAWEIPVDVDYSRPFAAADHAAWRREYEALVEVEAELDLGSDFWGHRPPADWPFALEEWEEWNDGVVDLRSLRSAERLGADGAPAEHLGDDCRPRRDRQASGDSVDCTGRSQDSTD